ncbi:hypothetical protein P4E94_06840 [Pontiellaceae bacterium B12219]|nr:hypothetical protein [Pontiellaceae bacterium B12219]
MVEKKSSSIKSAFGLTKQEKLYILLICTLFILGAGARYLYLNNRNPTVYPPVEKEVPELNYE